MKKFIIIVVFLLGILSNTNSFAQNIYRTQNGDMVITYVSEGIVYKLYTKEMVVLLDYDNATFEMKMDKSTFHTGNDSIDKKLSFLKYEIIGFRGKLDLEYINTMGHPPLDFEVEGVLSTNDSVVRGSGHLEHLSNKGAFSCLLSFKFQVKISDLGLNLNGLSVDDNIEIEIVQIVLNKVENQ